MMFGSVCGLFSFCYLRILDFVGWSVADWVRVEVDGGLCMACLNLFMANRTTMDVDRSV